MTMRLPISPSRTSAPLRRLPLLVALFSTAMLAGCAGTNRPASVLGGECHVFERPQYVVLGKTRYDQRFVDTVVESGVGACGWERPAPRPASLNAAPGAKPAPVVAPKKRGMFRRIKDRLTGTPAPAQVAVPEFPAPLPAPAPQTVAPPALPPPAPIDPVKQLLHPKG